MTPWVGITPVEFAYLAFSELQEASILDALGLPAVWLRNPDVQDEGARVFAARIDQSPEVEAAGWALLAATARAVAVSTTGSAVMLRGADDDACLVTVPAAQIYVRPEAIGVRLLEAEVTATELADELLAASRPTSAFGVLWVGSNMEHLAWNDGSLTTGDATVPVDAEQAVLALSNFALDVKRAQPQEALS